MLERLKASFNSTLVQLKVFKVSEIEEKSI